MENLEENIAFKLQNDNEMKSGGGGGGGGVEYSNDVFSYDSEVATTSSMSKKSSSFYENRNLLKVTSSKSRTSSISGSDVDVESIDDKKPKFN
jgi:hypothetical protein